MRGRNKEHTTIIKRSSRKSHDAMHGGAWKVAFADFTLAMMALFMVLWIMGAVTEEERKEIVSLLHGESIFEGNAITPVTQKDGNGGQISLIGGRHDASEEQPKNQVKTEAELAQQVNKTESLDAVNGRSKNEIERECFCVHNVLVLNRQ